MSDCRIPLLPRDDATKAAEEIGVNAAFAQLNIFRLLLRRPHTAKAMADLLVSLLFRGELDARLRELVIMRIGWTTGSDYEWTQHWPIAQQFGCTPEELLAVKDGNGAAGFDETDRTILGATDELLATGTLSAERFAACVGALGEDPTLELVAAVGTWQMVSKLTRALTVPLEEGVASWPPEGTPSPAA